MNHPRSRGERRAVREAWIARRKFRWLNVWHMWKDIPHEGKPLYQQQPGWYTPIEYGMYAKWNMNCGSSMCHSAKYFKCKRKRRRALQSAESQADFRKKNNAIQY